MPKKDKPLDPSQVPMTPEQQEMMQKLLMMMASNESKPETEAIKPSNVNQRKAKPKKRPESQLTTEAEPTPVKAVPLPKKRALKKK